MQTSGWSVQLREQTPALLAGMAEKPGTVLMLTVMAVPPAAMRLSGSWVTQVPMPLGQSSAVLQ